MRIITKRHSAHTRKHCIQRLIKPPVMDWLCSFLMSLAKINGCLRDDDDVSGIE